MPHFMQDTNSELFFRLTQESLPGGFGAARENCQICIEAGLQEPFRGCIVAKCLRFLQVPGGRVPHPCPVWAGGELINARARLDDEFQYRGNTCVCGGRGLNFSP